MSLEPEQERERASTGVLVVGWWCLNQHRRLADTLHAQSYTYLPQRLKSEAFLIRQLKATYGLELPRNLLQPQDVRGAVPRPRHSHATPAVRSRSGLTVEVGCTSGHVQIHEPFLHRYRGTCREDASMTGTSSATRPQVELMGHITAIFDSCSKLF